MFTRKLGVYCSEVLLSAYPCKANMAKTQRNLEKLARPFTMLAKEKSLPCLPVPPLQQTTEKYLVSIKPLLTDNEFSQTEALTNEFRKPGGVGEQLQGMLVNKAKGMDSWLAEWWDNVAYFEYSSPVVVHSSPGIVFPKQEFRSQRDQLRYAAKLIKGVVSFKALIDSESLPVDMQGKEPLTMVQYTRLLSACRIPYGTRDYTSFTPKGLSKTVLVARNGQFFEVQVYNNGKSLSEDELVAQLENIVQMSSEPEKSPVGILTTTDRRIWAKTYKDLNKDSTNKKSLEKINNSIFLLCLDKPGPAPSNIPTVSEDPIMTVSLKQMLHGGGSDQNSCNRWFDKVIQFVVSENGHVGVTYEHSTAEAPPVQVLCNHLIRNCVLDGTDNTSALIQNLEPPQKLEWNLSTSLEEKIQDAIDGLNQLVDDIDMRMIRYRGCGKNIPKKHKLSPDAFFQIALQLAYFRLHGHVAPTYESASIRKFKLGRTETIRSASIASTRFCKAMETKTKTDSELCELMIKAMHAHTKYTRESGNGQGVDRHLLGLKLIAGESGVKLPEFYRDKGYNYSSHWKLSTSQVPSPNDTLLCFGPVVSDGYGVCYNPMETHYNVAISAFNSNPETNAGRLGESLSKSFDDMQVLLARPKL